MASGKGLNFGKFTWESDACLTGSAWYGQALKWWLLSHVAARVSGGMAGWEKRQGCVLMAIACLGTCFVASGSLWAHGLT